MKKEYEILIVGFGLCLLLLLLIFAAIWYFLFGSW